MPDAACYKFTVASAEQAAALIREHLGPTARVLSVRTGEAAGLRRLWAAPRLEVIAQIDPPVAPAEAVAAVETPPPPPSPEAEPSGVGEEAATTPRLRTVALPKSLPDLLRRSGLTETALGYLQTMPAWSELQTKPLHEALADAGRCLRQGGQKRPLAAPLSRAAFFGPPGAGRTTALCKWLGVEVFRRGRSGHVVLAEFERPNTPGPLPIFCEALGIPLAHYPATTQPATSGGFVYVDLPGLSLSHPSENAAITDFLDREQIGQRVLVLNAAYDHAILRAAYGIGREMRATHVVFTHLDEVPQWGRLWDYLFDGGIAPLFLATGPSLTGDCEEEVQETLLRRTLPYAEPDGCAGPGGDFAAESHRESKEAA